MRQKKTNIALHSNLSQASDTHKITKLWFAINVIITIHIANHWPSTGKAVIFELPSVNKLTQSKNNVDAWATYVCI
jgi:hypothetical protein